ncbi:hypothetical protein O181_040724 [Austropuccinia psidii MF-1]|uniref:Uncharacterized protein n=1 Tax=Austropuccinia psidii MF-1 TaxID=1389203 RepID=A0A9Q3HFT8_9BASI|nr:hypothetical protein [Austropuccinia psidii MF-1]
MGQALLKTVPKFKEWPHFSGEGNYDHMELIRGIEIIEEDFELPERLVTARYNTMFTRKISRQCGGDFEHAVKHRTSEQSSTEDLINILEEVTTRTRIGSSRVNLNTRFNTPLKGSVDKNPKANSNNIKYKSSDVMRKCHIFQSTTHLANKCTKKGKINEIYIEKEPDVEKAEVNEDHSDDKSSIFSEDSKDIENINATFDIMEAYSHLTQLSNGKLDLSRIQDAQTMKRKSKRGKGYKAGNSFIIEVVIDKTAH